MYLVYDSVRKRSCPWKEGVAESTSTPPEACLGSMVKLFRLPSKKVATEMEQPGALVALG